MLSLYEIVTSVEVGLLYGIVALGVYFTFRVIDYPDLTADGSFVLGAAVSSSLILAGYNPWISLIGALIAGGGAGLATGFLSTKLKISNLLSGILVAFMLYSVNLRVMGGLPNCALIGEPTIFDLCHPLLVLALFAGVIGALAGYFLLTDAGIAMRSVGYNKRLALNNGVHVNKVVLAALAVSNAFIALGGALFSQYQGFADISLGIGTIIIALAALMIGERLFVSRSPFVIITGLFIGSLLYRFFVCIALYSDALGLQTQDLNVITGVLVILVMISRKRQTVC